LATVLLVFTVESEKDRCLGKTPFPGIVEEKLRRSRI